MSDKVREGDRVMLTRNVFALPRKGSLGKVTRISSYGRITVLWETGKVSTVPPRWIRKPNALELLAMEAGEE